MLQFFKKFSLNIGIRQNGRLMGSSVINSEAKITSIIKSFNLIEKKLLNKNIFKNIFLKKNSSEVVIKNLKMFIK